MPLVNVMVNNRAYTIACDEGEEDHLRQLAGHVDGKVKELLGSVGQVGDQRLLLPLRAIRRRNGERVEHRARIAVVQRLGIGHDRDAKASERVRIGVFLNELKAELRTFLVTSRHGQLEDSHAWFARFRGKRPKPPPSHAMAT